jgi:putative zinc finger/helix-turn-helix YgiT family protein
MSEVVMDKKLKPESNCPATRESLICPDCGSSNIETRQKDYVFPYGSGENKVELAANVPVRSCSDCGFSFIDSAAEDICHNAVCQHLGVMTPLQIRDLRNLYGLTQAQFSEITKLGEATLSRWERGIVIQNQAYDNYLYLLGFTENLERVRDCAAERKTTEQIVDGIQSPQFRELDVTEELLERKMNFRLVPG